MRYLALVLVVVLAAAPPCPAELAQLTTTLTPTTLDFTIEVTLVDQTFIGDDFYTVSDTAISGLTGVQGIRLDCGFDASSHAVTSVNSIVFLLSYGDKIDFTDNPSLNLNFTNDQSTQFASLSFDASGLGGSLSTGLQEPWRSPPVVPDPMPVTNGTFPLDRRGPPQGFAGG